jgi:hypothetical protein
MSYQHPRPGLRPRSQANTSDSNSDGQPPALIDFSSNEQNEDRKRVLGFLNELLQANAIRIPPYHPDSTRSSSTRGPGVYDRHLGRSLQIRRIAFSKSLTDDFEKVMLTELVNHNAFTGDNPPSTAVATTVSIKSLGFFVPFALLLLNLAAESLFSYEEHVKSYRTVVMALVGMLASYGIVAFSPQEGIHSSFRALVATDSSQPDCRVDKQYGLRIPKGDPNTWSDQEAELARQLGIESSEAHAMKYFETILTEEQKTVFSLNIRVFAAILLIAATTNGQFDWPRPECRPDSKKCSYKFAHEYLDCPVPAHFMPHDAPNYASQIPESDQVELEDALAKAFQVLDWDNDLRVALDLKRGSLGSFDRMRVFNKKKEQQQQRKNERETKFDFKQTFKDYVLEMELREVYEKRWAISAWKMIVQV